MLHVDDQPETLHIYVVRDEAPKPQLFPIVLAVLALFALVVLSVAVPYKQPVARLTLRFPAVPLAIKIFKAQVPIIPTSIKTYPATIAQGVLTITNGSVIGQSIPAGFTIQGVVTDTAVYVPPGNANGYGYATVQAHALISGKVGNLATLTINQVIGTSIYIRNLSAFSGGKDSYSVKIITAQDRSTAVMKARYMLLTLSTGLHYPCSEDHFADAHDMVIAWHCQMISYHIATFYHITDVRIIGKNLFISVWFVPRPIRYWVK